MIASLANVCCSLLFPLCLFVVRGQRHSQNGAEYENGSSAVPCRAESAPSTRSAKRRRKEGLNEAILTQLDDDNDDVKQ